MARDQQDYQCVSSWLQKRKAVKFISGGMKSSPIAACEIDSIIEYFIFRREASVVEMAERFRGSDIDNPSRKIIDKWTPS